MIPEDKKELGNILAMRSTEELEIMNGLIIEILGVRNKIKFDKEQLEEEDPFDCDCESCVRAQKRRLNGFG